jgi:hypothetical protein
MQELAEILSTLKRARVILGRSYIPFLQFDGNGGHCALGAISEVKYGRDTRMSEFEDEALALSETAKALHPEFIGTYIRYSGSIFSFNIAPIVFINNYLGKEATLRVFDVTIAELELRLTAASEPVASEARETLDLSRELAHA